MADESEPSRLPGKLERTLKAASEFISENKQWAQNAQNNWAANEKVKNDSVPSKKSAKFKG